VTPCSSLIGVDEGPGPDPGAASILAHASSPENTSALTGRSTRAGRAHRHPAARHFNLEQEFNSCNVSRNQIGHARRSAGLAADPRLGGWDGHVRLAARMAAMLTMRSRRPLDRNSPARRLLAVRLP
jgi:hypothetical protein